MIQLGCCVFSFGLGLEESLRLAGYLGFRAVDVGASGPTAQVNQEAAANNPSEHAKAIRELSDRYGLAMSELFATAIHVDGKPIQVTDTAPGARARLLARFRGLCQYAAEAGFKSVMGGAGRVQEALGPQGSWDAAAETMTHMVAVAREYGLLFTVEPSTGSLLDPPAAAIRMAQQVSGLYYTLDYAHYTGQGIPQSEIMPLNAYAGHFHGKAGAPGLLKAFAHHNTIDFRAIIDDLEARQWNGVIAIECIGRPPDDPTVSHPVYTELSPEGLLPQVPGIISHPLFQVLDLGTELEKLL
jgi:sugar phosphate isomerase/epimerase